MSGSPQSAGKPGKAMSSRLLTMKFMQRAAASKAAKEPETPESDEQHTPDAKRRRVSTEPGSLSTPQSELDAIAAAVKAEEQTRREAVMRQAAEAGESEWVLDIPAAYVPPPQPYAVAADSLDAEEDVNVGGRRAFGNYKRKKRAGWAPNSNGEATGNDEGAEGDPNDPEQARKAELVANAARRAANPDKMPTSISGNSGYIRDPSNSKKNKNKRNKS